MMNDSDEYQRQLDENRRACELKKTEIRTKYAGQYIGFAFGKVIAADRDYHQVKAAVDALDPKPEISAVFRAEEDRPFGPFGCVAEEKPTWDSAEFERQLELNRRAYAALRDEIVTNYVGQYVAIAFGKIIATDRDFFRLCGIVEALDPQPESQAVFLAGDDPAFEPVTCYHQGDFLPWEDSAGAPMPMDGMSSMLSSDRTKNP